MKIRTGDKVQVISGKDKGKTGEVLKVYKETGKVLVEGLNMVKKHLKPGVAGNEGGIVHLEKPINVSNVMYYDKNTDEPTRLGYKLIDGKKYRISKKTGDVVDA